MASQKSAGASKPERFTANLSDYPDLVIIYLGMRANSVGGIKTLASFGPQIRKAVADKPDGLLLHENLVFSMLPLMRGCVSIGAISIPSRSGHARAFTPGGGKPSCETEVAPAFGTRRTSAAVRSNPSISTCRPSGSPSLETENRHGARCSPLGAASASSKMPPSSRQYRSTTFTRPSSLSGAGEWVARLGRHNCFCAGAAPLSGASSTEKLSGRGAAPSQLQRRVGHHPPVQGVGARPQALEQLALGHGLDELA